MIKKPATTKILFIVSAIIIVNEIAGCGGNQKLIGRAFYFEDFKSCTKLNCNCCNDCGSELLFITDKDTIKIFGTRTEKDIKVRCKKANNDVICSAETLSTIKRKVQLYCSGKECKILSCTPFEFGKDYEVTGSFLPQKKEEVKRAFNVVKFKMIK